jgi:hypothetical protein
MKALGVLLGLLLAWSDAGILNRRSYVFAIMS